MIIDDKLYCLYCSERIMPTPNSLDGFKFCNDNCMKAFVSAFLIAVKQDTEFGDVFFSQFRRRFNA